MIEVHNLSVQYKNHTALKNISLSIYSGETLAIVGPNGSGKTTLLRTLLRLQHSSEGYVLLDGEDMASLSTRAIARKIAYLPQLRNIPNITVKSMVLHGRFPYLDFPRRYRKLDYEIVEDALKRVGALDLSDWPMNELSGGQRQNIYVAMALAQQAETFLMDEPTTYMDVHRQLELMGTVRKLSRHGSAVVMVLHDLCLAMRYADRLAILSDGQLVAVGTPDELYDSNLLEKVFRTRLMRTAGSDGWRYYYD